MKLSNHLVTSGVLERGEPRHCSDWEINSAPVRPFGEATGDMRQPGLRRRAARPVGVWVRAIRFLGRAVKT